MLAVCWINHTLKRRIDHYMGDQPVIASKVPAVMKMEAGEYWWCSCGKSKGQPFCDGSHKGSSFTPQKVVIEETRNIAFCNCKHSANGAFCDGSHSSLS